MSEKDRTVMFQMPSMLAGSLACVEGTVKGRSFELTAGTFVIGRLDSCDLNLSHEPGVSKTHAKIIAEGDKYVLVDCESRNGTIVNGVPVQRKALQDGDEIRVCGCVLRFTQRMATATGIKVRNADLRDSRGSMDLSVDEGSPAHIDATDPGGEPVSLNVSAPIPSVAPPSTSSGSVNQAFVPTAFEMPTFPQSAVAPAAQGPASQGRTLLTWYAGGLMSALLFGGSASAVIVGRAPEAAPALAAAMVDAGPQGDSASPPDAKPADAKPTDGQPTDAKPTDPPPTEAKPADANPADANPADGKPADDKPSDDAAVKAAEAKLAEAAAVEAAAAERAAKERADAEAAKAAEAQAAKERADAAKLAAAASAEDRPRRARREREASSDDSTSAEPAGGAKQFPATAESARADALKSRGGKVKTVEAKDGDTVSKGQVLVTFEEGASESEIMSLKDRIATLEAVDSDEARADLKAARAKLDALTSGAKSPPVVASMSGVLSAFNVSVGDVLKQNGTIGRISDGAVPKRVRVRVDRSVRASRGQSVTLITSGGERTGTVSTVSGKTVTVDTGDTPATDVEAVRF